MYGPGVLVESVTAAPPPRREHFSLHFLIFYRLTELKWQLQHTEDDYECQLLASRRRAASAMDLSELI